MDLRQLRYFVAVAEHENFSRAAQQLYVAQSALSRRMQDLEQHLGVRLFDRHLRGATLTPEGRRLLDRARFLLRSLEQLRNDFIAPEHTPAGPVVVGMPSSFASIVGAQFARDVRCTFPQAHLRIVEGFSPDLRDMIRSGVIDMAVVTGNAPLDIPEIAVESLFDDQLCLVGPTADSHLQSISITVQQLRGLPLILSGMSSAGLRNELEKLASRKRVDLEVVIETASFNLALEMTALGLGYTVYVAAGVERFPDLSAVPISDLWLTRSLVWSTDRPMSRIGGEVLSLLRAYLLRLISDRRWRGARLHRNRR